MTLRNPPWPMAAGVYSDNDLRSYMAMMSGKPYGVPSGIIPASRGGQVQTELAATLPGGLSIGFAPGRLWIPGTDQAGQGPYMAEVTATETITMTAADPSQQRIDRVVAHVNDPAFVGSGAAQWTVMRVTGTPGGAAPAVPASSVPLYQVTVPAGAVNLVGGNLADQRTWHLPDSSQGALLRVGWVGTENGLGGHPTSNSAHWQGSFFAYPTRSYRVVFESDVILSAGETSGSVALWVGGYQRRRWFWQGAALASGLTIGCNLTWEGSGLTGAQAILIVTSSSLTMSMGDFGVGANGQSGMLLVTDEGTA